MVLPAVARRDAWQSVQRSRDPTFLQTHAQIGYVQTVRWRTPLPGSWHQGTHQTFFRCADACPVHCPIRPCLSSCVCESVSFFPFIQSDAHDTRSDARQDGFQGALLPYRNDQRLLSISASCLPTLFVVFALVLAACLYACFISLSLASILSEPD